MTRPIKQASIVAAFTLMGAGLAFLTQTLAARSLGPEQYGVFMAAFTLTNIVSPLAAFGLQGFWLKSFGREGWDAMRWIQPTFLFCAISTCITIVGLAVWALIGLGIETPEALCLLLLSANLLSVASIEVVSTRFLLEERPLPLMIWQTLPQIARFIAIAGATYVLVHPTAIAVSGLYAAVALVLLGASVPSIRALAAGRIKVAGHEKSGLARPSEAPSIANVASETWAFGLGNFFFLVFFQSSVVFISHYLGPEATATYGIAVTMLTALYILPTTIYQKMLMPRLHRWAYQDTTAFARAYRQGNAYMLALGLAAAASTALLSQFLIPLFFGTAYSSAATLLAWLAPCIPMRFVATSAGAILSTGNRMRTKIKLMAIVAVFNVALNFVLIREFAMHGAVAAAIATEAVLVILYLAAARNSFKSSAIKPSRH